MIVGTYVVGTVCEKMYILIYFTFSQSHVYVGGYVWVLGSMYE